MPDKLEIKILIAEENLIPIGLKSERDRLVANAREIKSVITAQDDEGAGKVVVALRKHAKDIEAMRTERTRPLLDAQKLIKSFFDEHSKFVNEEIERLKKLGGQFSESEKRRVEAEERKRREEFDAALAKQLEAERIAQETSDQGSKVQQMIAERKLAIAKQQVDAVISTPEPEINRAKGKTVKQVLKWEVTDLLALVKARPDLCKIEAKPSAINAVCHPNLPVPGLRLWFESESNYTSR